MASSAELFRPCLHIQAPTRRQLLASGLLFIASPAAARVVKVERGERDLVTLSSGVKYTELREGRGKRLRPGDLIVAHIQGFLEDGSSFLDTRQSNEPLAFDSGVETAVIRPGLLSGLEGARQGARRLVAVPASLGYGDKRLQLPQGTVPAKSDLLYDIELLRCNPGDQGGLLCCPDEDFPCQLPSKRT